MRQSLLPGAPQLMPTDNDRFKHCSITNEKRANALAWMAEDGPPSFSWLSRSLAVPCSGEGSPGPPDAQGLLSLRRGECGASECRAGPRRLGICPKHS